jgi:hypothetical protein
MATLDQFLKEAVPAVVYDESFLDVLEDHLTYFRTSTKTTTVSVSPAQADVYTFDLAALLNELNVPVRLHWLTMRMNDYTSMFENDATLTQLMVPDLNMFDKLVSVHQAALVKAAAAVQ